MRASNKVFIASTVAQAAGCAFCTFRPLHISGIPPLAASKTYTLANSNLDISLLTFANIVIFIATTWLAGMAKPRRGTSFRDGGDIHTRAALCLWLIAMAYQLLLLGKAVIVAILGEEIMFPTKKYSGLIYIYASILSGLLTSFIQAPAARRLIQNWKKEQKQRRSNASVNGSNGTGLLDTSVTTPLLLETTTEKRAGNENPSSSSSDESGEGDSEARKATIGALLKLSAPDYVILLLAFTSGAAAALGQALVPYYTGRIIDYASIDPDPSAFKKTTVKLLGVAFACAIFTGIRGGLFTISMTRLNVRLRRTLFESLMKQDPGFYDTTKTGEITSRLAADTTTVSDQISLNLNVMLRSATQAAMVLAFMFTASWRLTVVTFIMVPIVIAICKVYGGFYRKMSKKVQSELAAANSVAEEALGTMSTVKAHAAEGSTQAAYADKLHRFYTLQKKEAAAYAAYMATNTFLSAAVVAGVLFYGGSLVLSKAMSAGALVSFMLYQQSLSGAFQSLGDVFSALSAAVGAADKVVELMHRRPEIPPAGKLTPPQFFGRVELCDVHFAYPSRPLATVLSRFSLSVEPGEVVALVGPSGGGKSSIVKLVERFYLPTSGTVLIDGRDVGAYEPGWLRRHIGLVSQEPVLYARSIKRNIIYGLETEDGVPENEQPTQTDIEDAARLANAHEFISQLPQGYDTEIMGAPSLSGGQKQRLAIARALVRKPAVLLLDEATSALDADSEAVVQEALDRTMAGRTVLVIAHRLSTVQNASRIVVVQGGNVAEMGTHEELLDKGGAYAALVRRQLARSPSSAAMMNGLGLDKLRTESSSSLIQ
ncbi:hypothetical protein Ndes2437B_g06013 [Nannochloris sp. 'desiccata']|nr:hypothetical protein KSW81_007969 [Chlorella desiccata (nom. nud.)]